MSVVLRVADHPRARRAVRRARGFGGLAGFIVGAYLAHGAGLPGFDVMLRALLAGIGMHCIAWLLAVTYWRAAILAELETVRRRRELALSEAAGNVLRETAAN